MVKVQTTEERKCIPSLVIEGFTVHKIQLPSSLIQLFKFPQSDLSPNVGCWGKGVEETQRAVASCQLLRGLGPILFLIKTRQSSIK